MICFGMSVFDHTVGWVVGKLAVPRCKRRSLSLSFGTGVLHLIQINHQSVATIFQFIILTFVYSLTCFGRFPAHHQELNDCSGSLWFYLRIVVTVVLFSWSGLFFIEDIATKFEADVRHCVRNVRHHNMCWKWPPFASRQAWNRRAIFWKVLTSTSAITAWISSVIFAFKASTVRGLFW
jgi:hypothetical protein